MARSVTSARIARCKRELWHDRMEELCGRRALVQFSPEPFVGSIRRHEVGGISICHFMHNIRQLAQNQRPADRGHGHYMMLIMQLRGRSQLRQSNDDLALCAGTLAMIDGARPFVSCFDGPTSQLIAYLPAAEFADLVTVSGLARPCLLSGREGLGTLIRSTLLAITRSADQLLASDGVVARQALIGIVRRMIERDRRSTARTEQKKLPDSRYRAFIDAWLADPELGPAQVARGCGVSVRSLHRAFANSGWSVCGWIRHRRLEACRRELLDPAHASRSITEIAFRLGFSDASHFSHAFRRAYGRSPRELRCHS